MRFVLAEFMHETNTFSPLATGVDRFTGMGLGPLSGQEAIDALGSTRSSFGGFYETIRERASEIMVPCAATAMPSGKVTDEAFEHFAGKILEAVAEGPDAVFLSLHGAMVSESHDDAEGELLQRIRDLSPDMPIAVSLDFHTSMSPALCENATVVTGFTTYPHTDMFETAERAARTLLRSLDGEIKPLISWGVLPVMTNMLCQTPARQPMKDIMDLAIAAESDGEVLNASVFGGFPLSDNEHTGLAVVVVTDDDRAFGDAFRDRLLSMAWERRRDFVFQFESVGSSLDRAAKLDGGPIVLVDHGDNCGAGGMADVMAVLADIIERGFGAVVAGPYNDVAVAHQLVEAGVGATVTVDVGGKTAMPALGLDGEPLTLTGVVEAVSDGTFTATGPMMTGMTLHLGATALLRVGEVRVIVSSRPMEPVDLGFYDLVGVDPVAARYLLIKSRQHFRAVYEAIADHIVLIAGPGVCNEDLFTREFESIRRPMFPFDEAADAVIVAN